jgi:amino acid adenylation domain-containing protein
MSWSERDIAGSIGGRFDQIAAEHPDDVAVMGGAGPVTYAELGALADRYAAALLARGEDTTPVALLLPHDAPVIAASLAALKCARTVVTLNPSDPPRRLANIREAVRAQAMFVAEQHLDQARACGLAEEQIIVLSQADEPGHTPAPTAPAPSDLAFLISTSGSTGTPKVVMQSHRNVLHNVLRYTRGLGIGSHDRIAWLASLSGGQGIATAWTALLNGATLCPFPIAQRGVTGLAGWLEQHGVTVFDTIPSVLRNFTQTLHDERIPGVRLVRIASEGALRSDFEAFRRHFPADCVLASVLASSEAGIIAQAIFGPDAEVPDGPLPVGSPAEGITVQLLDAAGDPVPDGEPGEIVIDSVYLSPGYLNDPELTASRFEERDGLRRLRTGDMARRVPDHGLVILGRADKQVKVRGNRLQLEEVEAALASHPAIAAAAVAVQRTGRGDARLTAFLAARAGQEPQAEELRGTLAATLPPHAIPSAFVFLDQLPLTPHGKIDRQRLAELRPHDQADGTPGATAQSETEELLVGLWSEAFEREVEAHDGFLGLGGDSLTAAVIAAGVHELFGVELDLRVFASDLTVSSLAALVERRRGTPVDEDLPPLTRTLRSGPLSSAQARLWRPRAFERTDPFWNVAVPFRLRGALDVEALRGSIDEIVRRHEILRTTFTEVDGRPLAVVQPHQPLELHALDLRGEADPHARAGELGDAELLETFDLERGPLLRFHLLRLGDQEYQLLRLSHHLIHDALSWRIFFKELAVLYEARVSGGEAALPEPPLQYIDYAIWERAAQRPRSRRFRTEIAWWLRELDPPVPELELPFRRAQPEPSAPAREGFLRWGIPPEHSQRLDAIGRESGATYFMTRLAAFAALLALDTSNDDLVIGTPFSTRTRAELQGMIGLFLNFAPVRLRFHGDPSFREWVRRVRRAVIDTSAHVTIPAQKRVAALRRHSVRWPQPQARFVAWTAVPPMSFGGIELEPLPRRCAEAFGFRLGVNRVYESERCWVEFDAQAHDAAAVQEFVDRLQTLIAAVGAEPDRSVRDLHTAIAVL